MFRDIWTKTLWDGRRTMLGWGIGIIAVTFVYASFYPLIATPAYEEMMANMPDAMLDFFGWQDLTSAAGYLGSTVFGLLGPVLVIIFAIGLGTKAIAGDEEAGTLELVLTLPVTRTRIVVHRAVAMVVAMIMAGVLVFATVAAVNGPAELGIALGNVAAASLLLGLLGLTFGALALFVGALTGKKGTATAVTAGVAVVSYLAANLASTVDWLAWTQRLSPFEYYSGSDPLRNGLPGADVAILVLVCLALVAAANVSFGRRDVGV